MSKLKLTNTIDSLGDIGIAKATFRTLSIAQDLPPQELIPSLLMLLVALRFKHNITDTDLIESFRKVEQIYIEGNGRKQVEVVKALHNYVSNERTL